MFTYEEAWAQKTGPENIMGTTPFDWSLVPLTELAKDPKPQVWWYEWTKAGDLVKCHYNKYRESEPFETVYAKPREVPTRQVPRQRTTPPVVEVLGAIGWSILAAKTAKKLTQPPKPDPKPGEFGYGYPKW